MRIMPVVLLSVSLVLLGGCYARFNAPSQSLAVKVEPGDTSLRGVSTCTRFLWVFLAGDCSIRTAMHDGGIDRVHHVDTETLIVLRGLWSRRHVHVYGE